MTMVTKAMDRIRTVVQRRIEIAERWHKLKTPDEICEFVACHPDMVELLADQQIQKEIIMKAMALVLDHASVDLDGCREKHGREFVDLVVAAKERYLAKLEDDEGDLHDRQPADHKRERRREQQRRHRQREREGRRVYAVELDGRVIDALVRLEWLADTAAGDDHAVGCAVARLLSDMAQAPKKP